MSLIMLRLVWDSKADIDPFTSLLLLPFFPRGRGDLCTFLVRLSKVKIRTEESVLTLTYHIPRCANSCKPNKHHRGVV